jgi:hypothetical protein
MHGNGLMKFAGERPYADPEKAARKLVEIANAVEAVQDGRIYIELATRRSYSNTKPARPNTRPALIWRWSAAGCCCTNAGPM